MQTVLYVSRLFILGVFLYIERANMLLSIFHLYQMLLPPFTPGSTVYLCIQGDDSIWKICLKCVTRCSESFSGADGLVAFKFLSIGPDHRIPFGSLSSFLEHILRLWYLGLCEIPTEQHLPKAQCHISLDHSASAHGSQNGNVHWSNAGSFVFLGKIHLVAVSGSSKWFLIIKKTHHLI